MASLLLEPQSWATRRVEVISHAASSETRRSISLDFRLPEHLKIVENPGTVLVPLALLRKGPLTHLDVRDDTGRSVPVLDRDGNAVWAERAVVSTLTGDFDLPALSVEQKEAVERIVGGGDVSLARAEADQFKRQLLQQSGVEIQEPQGEDVFMPTFALLDDLASHFILLAELPDSVVGRRCVVKFSYEDSPGPAPVGASRLLSPRKREQIESLPVADAASYHLELRPPVGVSARSLAVFSSEASGPWLTHSPGPIAHINVRDTTPGASHGAFADLRPMRAGLTSYATLAALLAFALFLVPVLWPEAVLAKAMDSSAGATTATALLAVPAFLLALLSRPPEHPVVSEVYFPVRLVTAGTALMLLAAAVAFSMVRAQGLLHNLALVLMLVQGLLAVYSLCIIAMSDPPHTVKSWERLRSAAKSRSRRGT